MSIIRHTIGQGALAAIAICVAWSAHSQYTLVLGVFVAGYCIGLMSAGIMLHRATANVERRS